MRARSTRALPTLLLLSLLAFQATRMAAPGRSVLPPTCAVRVLRVGEDGALLGCGGEGMRDGDVEGRAGSARMAGPALRLLGLPVDVNHGSVEDLEALPGIGPKLAERILAARPFAQPSDLQRIPGIGPKRWAQLQPVVTATAPMSAQERSRANHL